VVNGRRSQIFERELSNVMAGNRKYVFEEPKNPPALSGIEGEERGSEDRIISARAKSRAGRQSRMTWGDRGFE
jgi:hypothetical protein